MRHHPALNAMVFLGLLVLTATRPAGGQQSWPPVTEEEKALKDCPQQPGAPAVFLYRESIDDENDFTTFITCRLKILTPAGKERATIEIPFVKGYSKVKDLRARVVRPNGTVEEFSGQVYEKTVVRAGGYKVKVMAFALPGVDVGAIIDYSYKIVLDESGSSSKKGLEDLAEMMGPQGKPREGGIDTETSLLFFPVETWDLQEDLFTRKAKFVYVPSARLEELFGLSAKRMRMTWVTLGLKGDFVPERKKGRVQLELENIPAFEHEEYMTPESSLRMAMRLYYIEGTMDSADQYWKEESKNWQNGAEKFMRKSGTAAAEAQRLVAGIDDPLAKIGVLYGRAQEIRNLSYDKTLTTQRKKELDIKDNRSVADVLKRGYGLRSDITRAFAAMAKAAGFEVRVVRAATRDDKFFDKNLYGLYDQFDCELAMVRLGNRDQLFDPATPFCPPGLVRWNCTDTVCLAPSDEPPSFLKTPVYPPDMALTQREIALSLDLEGNLAGTAKVTFQGQEALIRRVEHIGEDEVAVKKDLEAEMAAILPSGSKVTLRKVDNIANNADSVLAQFDLSLPGLATLAGERILLPVSPLLGSRRHPFRHDKRKYPVYFPYPYREFDDIVVTLPAGLRLETKPDTHKIDREAFGYSLVCALEDGQRLHVQRDLVVKKNYFPVLQYLNVKTFFDQVTAGDEEQIILAVEKK
jgi:Domain of Unknown Function with PDB structure (DUF3857)/Transglutaminase-like superfamily